MYFRGLNNVQFASQAIETPRDHEYAGLRPKGEVSAVVVLRGGSALEPALRKTIPDCRTGRLLIQSDWTTGEPELHFLRLPVDIHKHESVLLLDTQMASGGAALMAVQVLLDHGVALNKIVLTTYSAGRVGLHRLMTAFPEITVVVCNIVAALEQRWVEKRYFRS